MTRLLFWIALVILVIFALRSKLRGILRQTPPPDRESPRPTGGDIETMACCAHCGVHFPASEAVRADGLDYCSPAHVRLPPK